MLQDSMRPPVSRGCPAGSPLRRASFTRITTHGKVQNLRYRIGPLMFATLKPERDIHDLYAEAIAAETPEELDRVIPKLRQALHEHCEDVRGKLAHYPLIARRLVRQLTTCCWIKKRCRAAIRRTDSKRNSPRPPPPTVASGVSRCALQYILKLKEAAHEPPLPSS
jgi:hypothetical protein